MFVAAKNTRYLTILASTLLPLAVVLAGCPEKETESEPATVAPTPAPTVSVAPEEDPVPEAGPDADADADAGKKKVWTKRPSSLARCCAAIRQNRKSAPPAQWMMYDAALAVCQSGAIPPQFRSLAPCK